MESHSLQIQSVLYGNEKVSVKRAIDSLANAVRINKKTANNLSDVVLCYGDASKVPVFSDEEISQIKAKYADALEFKYIFFDENTGSAKGHNKLGDICESEYMMIMNPDVIVCPRFFEPMFAFFDKEESDAGMVEARQTPVEHPKEYDRVTFETSWATTACAIFTTEMFRELDGFDYKTFFLYCDDVDFSWRVRLKGKKVYYAPKSVVFHAKTLTVNGQWSPTSAEVYYSAEAAILLAYKWSNQKRAEMLYKNFLSTGDPNLVKAAQKYKQLKDENALPQQLDSSHKVAEFVGDFYTKHRFSL